MARQTFWKGYLKLSLVTASVSLTPATTESNKVRFHVLNRKTSNRVESRYVDSVTHKAVSGKEQVKGYPKGEDDYVILEDDEIEEVGLESTRTIDVDTFVPRGSIDWIWYDKPHFLAPEDKVGTEAFCVIREAMRANNVVGIARLVLYRRERAVLLEPQGKGIILWTLHYGNEVREPVAHLDFDTKVDNQVLTMMKRLIKEETKEWNVSMVQDPIQKRLKTMIRNKTKSLKQAAPAKKRPAVKSTGNVINIMDALKKSLAAEGEKPRSPRSH
ncbi:ATP-dependent DNA helicase Ku-type protein (plasmid) [Rhizobium gallicum bv. gallicum R602sp]|uniref:Non-homologous end joining protein Ku n=1 Tax=Rhizobium gallicum bv. gallicum R602sp TaxID=1041138 RepID=A0A0B4XDZ5_9HYPH|nr:Ku protein [Rhizobium gallicum]AJD44945.1 ATP-dependent DNA helicase Ku-type protein [Rhizobium gallicum bv. gallicum R602sp]TDW33570.1 DNA end-binding protein Ku [Rhizobium azibense]